MVVNKYKKTNKWWRDGEFWFVYCLENVINNNINKIQKVYKIVINKFCAYVRTIE